jgi:hypothetical protein
MTKTKGLRCDHCGGVGPHLVPPMTGEPSFWLCDIPEQREADLRAKYEERLRSYHPESDKYLIAKGWLAAHSEGAAE